MPRLVVVLPLSPLEAGDSFAVQNWPLHITVMPPFLTDAAPSDIAHAIATATSAHPELTVTAGRDAMFGRRENIPVTLVVESPELIALHRTLLAAIRPFAATPDEPAFTGGGFRAHVTMKLPARVHEGEELILAQIALVDMAPAAGQAGRVVLATHSFRAR
jgi:2'-5' RNA ligase